MTSPDPWSLTGGLARECRHGHASARASANVRLVCARLFDAVLRVREQKNPPKKQMIDKSCMPPAIPRKILSCLHSWYTHSSSSVCALWVNTHVKTRCRNIFWSPMLGDAWNTLSFTFPSLSVLQTNHTLLSSGILFISRPHYPVTFRCFSSVPLALPTPASSPSLLLFLSAHGESALVLLPPSRPPSLPSLCLCHRLRVRNQIKLLPSADTHVPTVSRPCSGMHISSLPSLPSFLRPTVAPPPPCSAHSRHLSSAYLSLSPLLLLPSHKSSRHIFL